MNLRNRPYSCSVSNVSGLYFVACFLVHLALGTLRTLINSAERALSALAERDNLLETLQAPSPTPEHKDVQNRDFAVEQQ